MGPLLRYHPIIATVGAATSFCLSDFSVLVGMQSEDFATGHIDTGFLVFSAFNQILRWFSSYKMLLHAALSIKIYRSFPIAVQTTKLLSFTNYHFTIYLIIKSKFCRLSNYYSLLLYCNQDERIKTGNLLTRCSSLTRNKLSLSLIIHNFSAFSYFSTKLSKPLSLRLASEGFCQATEILKINSY